jgi:hypothetical protein
MNWRTALGILAVVLIAVGAWEVLSAYYAAWRSSLPDSDQAYFGGLAVWRFYAALALCAVGIVLLIAAWRHRRQSSN